VSRKTYIYSRKELTHRTTLPLTKEMDLFLRDLSGRCKEGDGRHMDKSQLLRAMLAVLMGVSDRLDVAGVKDEAELVERIRRAVLRR
jgi:hypothetical protein